MATTAERAAHRALERGGGGEDQNEREEDGRSGGEEERDAGGREVDQEDDYQDAGDSELEVRERAPTSLYPGSAHRSQHLYQRSPGSPAPKTAQVKRQTRTQDRMEVAFVGQA